MNTPRGTLVDSFEPADDNAYNSLGVSYDATYQSWESGVQPQYLTGGTARLERVGDPGGEIVYSVRAHAGTFGTSSTPTGSALVSSLVLPAAVIPATPTDVWRPFPQTFRPDPDTEYTFVVDASGLTNVDGSNYIRAIFDGGAAATHDGNTGVSTDNLVSWAAQGADLAFALYELPDFDVTALAAQAIESQLRERVAEFGGSISVERIAWDGTEFDPDEPHGPEDWLRPRVQFLTSEWMTHGIGGVGSNLHAGTLQLSIFTVPGYGMSAADQYATAARRIFDRAEIAITDHGNLEFGPAGPPRPGPLEASWLHTIVECPFEIVEHG